MESEELTQLTQNTQGVVDPRRLGRNNSGLREADISDVLCILHPCSPAAFKVVASTAERAPHNVLQNNGSHDFDDGLTQAALEEQETFILSNDTSNQAMDLALRFSARPKNFRFGFLFGRHLQACDIVVAADTCKRVSNTHFSIFINNSGVLMLQDMSTNGTVVDDVVLRGKTPQGPQTRMLNPGSIIQILSPKAEEVVKFIVRIPSREGHFEEYEAKFQAWMQNVAAAEAEEKENKIINRRLAAAQPPKTQNGGSLKAPLVQNQYGMHWSGGDRYNVVGHIGKGAFATVYQLATKSEGQLYAAKELEKRKFMKNGVLDRKLDNEMQIMKAISHENIVQYVDYQHHVNHMYIIMEFVSCGDLQQYLTNNGPLLEDLGRKMARQILDALAYLHRKKITHRDIKPDNILLANLDPNRFTVKLSDFGLSKVVTDNETFLKTFCGTLLYCAPEVFPHYDAHVSGKRKKRPRKGAAQQPSKFHSYSQSVDTWSFGAVLWYALCLKPPFEGVQDITGKGMFDKIMMTPLDARDLVRQGVSDDAVALLVEMLNTDPASRPSPADCLRHRWFGQYRQAVQGADLLEDGLVSIAEEEEIDAENEPDVSGLSLDEQEDSSESQTSEVSIHSGSLEFLNPRQSKRFKHSAYREPGEMIDSSPELLYQSIPIIHQPDPSQVPAVRPQHGQPKLFGEISQSALGDSAELGRRTSDAVDMLPASIDGQSDVGLTDSAQQAPQVVSRGAMASPSLLGAESLVRELKMGSPHSGDHSHNADSNGGPKSPRTPGAPEHHARANGTPNVHDDVTPKQPHQALFSRQIHIPIPASFYYDANDPATHTLEYASKISGHDYITNPSSMVGPSETSLPATMSGSATDNEEEDEDNTEDAQATAQQPPPPTLMPAPSEFVKPPPRLGRLFSTLDSFAQITLNLSTRISVWGRMPSNTHVYPNGYDTRVPKRGIIIHFHAKGIERIPEEDQQDWMKLPDLHCTVATQSTHGLLINGITLKDAEQGKRAFGRIYSGDEITVLQSQEGKPGLKFTCEFFHGEAKGRRPENGPIFKVEKFEFERSHQRSKGKEREKIVAPTGKVVTA